MADAEDGVEANGSTITKVLDLVGLSLLVVILLRILDGILQASLLSDSVQQVGGSGLNDFAKDLPTYERISVLTGWADLFSGIVVLAAVGLLVLPRLSWEEDSEEAWPTRARLLLTATAVLAALAFVAATTDDVWFRSDLSVGIPMASVIVEGLANIILPAVAAVLAWLSRRYWAVTDDESPVGDELS
jgi:hypothetical protein